MRFMIRLSSYGRNPSVGVFARANDRFAVVPFASSEKFANDLSDSLMVDTHRMDVADTSLVGIMMALNNKGMILPRNTTHREFAFFKELDINVEVLDDKPTALGNLVLANDYGALISTLFSDASAKKIADALDVEVVPYDFQEYRTIGSVGLATSKGALLHPSVSEKDLDFVEKILKVEADIGTVNRGIGYVRTGIVVNSNGALIGNETTSPEISRIQDALGLL